MDQLNQMQSEGLNKIQAISSLKELEDARVSYLGKNGQVTQFLKQLGNMPAEERKDFGQAVNQIKVALQNAIDTRENTLEEEALNARLVTEAVDVTLPAAPYSVGKMHPISYVIEEIGEVLGRMGYKHNIGNEIESDFYNFTALNIPDDHPARQDHDTFYFNETDKDGNRLLLRTQTSNVQIHSMEKYGAPLRVMSIGRVYRCDSDLTHTPQFHQVEVIALEKDLTFGHLKGTLQKFLETYFERPINMRLRPNYFPFTEPGAEVDIECLFCKGDGCRVCSHTGWIEVLGSGMVHRNVLAHCNVDHTQWQGFAFGAGVERLAMLKYGINDLRMFFESHAQFLRHYGQAAASTKGGL